MNHDPVRNVVVGTAGHIDHGKSALVLALTGSDPDRLKEEKDRGITIELGFANYRQDALNVAFVDVPGHERFVRTMLAGASGIDCVLLVVAADESVMPQTREHFDICRLLGVRSGLVVLTKSDLVDEETLELVQMETRELVEGSFLEDAPIVDVSARTGAGLDELRRVLAGAVAALEPSATSGITRLPVDRAFTVRGFGTVVTGTLVSGVIAVGMALSVQPSGRHVKVRGLQVHGEATDRPRSGQRVAVNLAGLDVGDLSRGDVLVQPDGLESTRRLDATLRLLPHTRPLKHGGRVRFHSGTSEVMARVSLASPVAGGPDEISPGVLDPGREAYVRVRLERPVALTRGDRFVLRAYSPAVTIAGGLVLDPAPGRGRLRSSAGLKRLGRLRESADPHGFLVAMVDQSGSRGLSRSRLTPRGGVAPADLDRVVESLVEEGRVAAVGTVLITPERVAKLRDLLIDWVSAFHAAHPLEPGLPREEARERFSHRALSELFDALVEMLVGDGTLTARDHLALSSHRIALSSEETRVHQDVERCYQRAGLSPPGVATVVAEARASEDTVDRMLKLLLRVRVLVKVESLIFHADERGRLKAAIVGLKDELVDSARLEIDMASFKERFGITRKFAIPLLGYLDRERVTRRVGNVRMVL